MFKKIEIEKKLVLLFLPIFLVGLKFDNKFLIISFFLLPLIFVLINKKKYYLPIFELQLFFFLISNIIVFFLDYQFVNYLIYKHLTTNIMQTNYDAQIFKKAFYNNVLLLGFFVSGFYLYSFLFKKKKIKIENSVSKNSKLNYFKIFQLFFSIYILINVSQLTNLNIKFFFLKFNNFFFILQIIFLFLYFKEKKLRIFYFYFIAYFLAFYEFFKNGSQINFIFLGLILCILEWYLKKKINFLAIFLSLFIIFSTQYFKIEYRIYNNNLIELFSKRIIQSDNTFIKENNFVNSYKDQSLGVSYLRIFMPAITFYIQEKQNVKNWDGKSYKPLLYILIPRVIWNKKPNLTYGNEYGKHIGIIEEGNLTSINLSVFNEAFINFGYYGLIIIMILGILSALVSQFLNFTLQKKNFIYPLVIMPALLNLIYIEVNMAYMLSNTILLSALALLIIYIFETFNFFNEKD